MATLRTPVLKLKWEFRDTSKRSDVVRRNCASIYVKRDVFYIMTLSVAEIIQHQWKTNET
jgi:hypothetical protein